MGSCYDGYGDGVKDVCERILAGLENELSFFQRHNEGDAFVCGVIGGLTTAIRIVKEEM